MVECGKKKKKKKKNTRHTAKKKKEVICNGKLSYISEDRLLA